MAAWRVSACLVALSTEAARRVSVAELDAMSASEASRLLATCCGAPRWVRAMAARRPFRTRDAVLSSADEISDSLDRTDWLEAFEHHPRIGERPSTGSEADRDSRWAAREQSGVDGVGYDVRAALAEVNREYEERFGHIFIVFATGKSAAEMLALAKARMRNDPEAELRIAAEEQRKITRLRLDKLLDKEVA
jgi:OHCU decarboxylase